MYQDLKLKLVSHYKGAKLTDEGVIDNLLDNDVVVHSSDRETFMLQFNKAADSAVVTLKTCNGYTLGAHKKDYVVLELDPDNKITGILSFSKPEDANEFFETIG
jgi:hypothetical protein